jgi:predicted lipid-binding transport protein (Tim44 family)
VAQPRRFGFGTGLVAGLFGAGLLGMLFGSGFFGGLAGIGSFLGMLIQIGLIAALAVFAVRWFRRRQEAQAGPGLAAAYARSAAGGPAPRGPDFAASGLGPTASAEPPRRSGPGDEVRIGERDYAAFERGLVELQDAYSRGDVAAIWSMSTPEMAGYIQEELNENTAEGLVNKIDKVRLVQGDLAEAWREGVADYATVAMRFAHTDATYDKASGRVVKGDPDREIEATELWTYRRDGGGPWKLSAIQQAN